MKIFTGEGMNPEEAFDKTQGLLLTMDVTKKFHKSGLDLNEFIEDYLTRVPSGYAYYIELRKPKTKIMKKKYKVVNIVNKTVRKWATIINFVDDNDTLVYSESSKTMTKAKAISKAKELVQGTGKDITITLTKQVVAGEPQIASVVTNPDIVTKGNYCFFGIAEVESIDDTE